MSDEAVIVKGTGTIFLAGPPLVKAATGEEVTAEELGGADVHTRVSGVADHFAEDDAHALEIARSILANLPGEKALPAGRTEPEEPAYAPREIYGVIPDDVRQPYDVREVIARLVDGSRFQEFKARYGTTLVCGFARLSSRPRTSSSSAPAEKCRFSFSRTSRGSWSGASTSGAASRRTARKWCTRSPTRPCRNSRS
jgi:acetyl-CoA carboxylase carboxyltransferase component